MWLYSFPVIAYLLGSVSSAIIIARLMGLPDPRECGSKNPGATNILRYGGKTAAVLTLLGDVLKGAVPVLIAQTLTHDTVLLALIGLGAFLGHLFPVYFGFRGGKGVATTLGVWLALSPAVGLAMAATWGVMALAFRYSSLAAIFASVAAPFYVVWFSPAGPYLLTMIVMSAVLIFRHRANIRSLLAGTETRIGKKNC
jgi:glycerol-3-phosphate acyltransferase PlsY